MSQPTILERDTPAPPPSEKRFSLYAENVRVLKRAKPKPRMSARDAREFKEMMRSDLARVMRPRR